MTTDYSAHDIQVGETVVFLPQEGDWTDHDPLDHVPYPGHNRYWQPGGWQRRRNSIFLPGEAANSDMLLDFPVDGGGTLVLRFSDISRGRLSLCQSIWKIEVGMFFGVLVGNCQTFVVPVDKGVTTKEGFLFVL